MKRFTHHTAIALALGLGVTLALLYVLSANPCPVLADPGDFFVTTGGTGTACTQDTPCALQTALGQAVNGDTIYVAQGIYTGTGSAVVTVTQSITLAGGWDGAPTGGVMRDPDTYTTALDGEIARRVVYISGNITPTLDGFSITRGDATGLGGHPWWGLDLGGGVYIVTATTTIRNSRVYSNTADRGGGLFLMSSNDATLSGNAVFSNTADNGGGLSLFFCDGVTLNGNTISENIARYGGGLYLGHTSDATLIGNSLLVNTAGFFGGGLRLESVEAVLQGNIVTGNVAAQGGGAYITGNSTLNANLVADNTAEKGGGLYLGYGSPTLTNNVIADNQADAEGSGSGLYCEFSTPLLLHTTIARNSGGDGSGIYATGYWSSGTYRSSTVVLSNTILVSHTVGITVTMGNTATLEATLWGSEAWANGSDWGGEGTIVTGAVNVRGDPAFVNSDAGDYHLTAASVALDRGVDAGVTADMDGEARPWPIGGGYDIGADELEYLSIYLPLVLRDD
jgi:parallel beta-helix repeat protein